ncbi:MAG: hypothetical protein ACO3JG_01450 [Luteolibacter sp.]
MRHRLFFFTAGLVVLVAALVALWAFRFEPTPAARTWTLADLRSSAVPVEGAQWTGTAEFPELRLWVDDAHPRVALRLALPEAAAVEMLHLRCRLSAKGLTEGAEKWQTGRIMIEWHPTDGAEAELDPVGGIVDDQSSSSGPMVAVSAVGPAIPALRLEHLGRAGEFTLSGLEIIPVRERALWKTGRWLLAAGFLGWFYALIRAGSRITRPRALSAALVWLLMGIHFVVPGPWKLQRPLLVAEFHLGKADRVKNPPQAPPSVAAGRALPYSGKVPPGGYLLPQGSLALKVKLLVSQVRFLLHILLLLAPTLVSAWLIGRRRTLSFAVLCAVSIELAQMAFGFRFDWSDAIDLFTDAAGIAAGLWLACKLGRWKVPE